jgi:hypothetical protein
VTYKSFLIDFPAGCSALGAEHVNLVSRRAALGHEPTFAACQRSVWNATVNRHSGRNVGKPRANTKEKQALLYARLRVVRQPATP